MCVSVDTQGEAGFGGVGGRACLCRYADVRIYRYNMRFGDVTWS